MTIEGLLLVGAIFGVIAAIFIDNYGIGCASLFIIPAAMIVLVSVEHHFQTGHISSTSALDFLFAPLWPSLGALTGYATGKLLPHVVQVRKQKTDK